jgi:hypothetical protein
MEDESVTGAVSYASAMNSGNQREDAVSCGYPLLNANF